MNKAKSLKLTIELFSEVLLLKILNLNKLKLKLKLLVIWELKEDTLLLTIGIKIKWTMYGCLLTLSDNIVNKHKEIEFS